MSTRILTGDCRDMLRTLPDESVHCVVTSPPYWGLRDYGTAKWEGGEAACDHIKSEMRHGLNLAQSAASTRGGAKKCADVQDIPFGNVCGKCGAVRIDSQLGLEPSPDAYVAAMVEVFREVRRVLRKDGTLWLNLGDSYAGGDIVKGNRPGNPEKNGGVSNRNGLGAVVGLKPKDLCGIPWKVAFALQADGWWLRQDIIWAKPNPMPESVTDRCTKAHEYLFMLTKSERYYYDAEAIAESSVIGVGAIRRMGATSQDGTLRKDEDRHAVNDGIRNRRSVWEVATQPFSEAHFATFPPALIEPCIKAGTSERGCCAKCGAPWRREVERSFDHGAAATIMERRNVKFDASRNDPGFHQLSGIEKAHLRTTKDLGWSPSCKCDAPTVPCTVLDPFAGAGTTGLVADRLQRSAILIELNPAYAAMSERRLIEDAPLFVEVAR